MKVQKTKYVQETIKNQSNTVPPPHHKCGAWIRRTYADLAIKIVSRIN